jgi:hypothetical protein
MHLVCRGLFISLAKYSPNQRSVTRRFRNFCTILITSRKLRHYFDEYQISVVTYFPLADILHNRDTIRCISKWAVELGALSINFKLRTTIKSQALVNFMAECRKNQF